MLITALLKLNPKCHLTLRLDVQELKVSHRKPELRRQSHSHIPQFEKLLYIFAYKRTSRVLSLDKIFIFHRTHTKLHMKVLTEKTEQGYDGKEVKN